MSSAEEDGGDPQRTMELLWGTAEERPRRGPKPRQSVRHVVQTAIELADAEGIEALTIRAVAERLGVSPMSVYTYVPGKADLLQLMYDTVCGETALDQRPDPVDPAGWRDRLEHVARDNHALLNRHPWLLQVTFTRPVLGPGTIAKYDRELQAVDGIGLSDVQMDSVVTLVTGFVTGIVRSTLESAQAERRSGMTDQQWWQANAPYLEKVFDPDRFPLAARVGATAGAAHQAAYSPDHAFEFGLGRLLDGIEAFIRHHTGG